jgi:hypothetical protein
MITYQLRLLDASNCNNLTPQALAGALKLFPGLVYLDLSGTTSARYQDVLSSFAFLPALQILKLQRLWLTDDDVSSLVRIVGRNLRSLDLRQNRITDRGIKELIQNSIRASSHLPDGRRSPPRLNTKLQQILESEAQEEHIRRRLTSGFGTDLGIEHSSGQGITHLYVSGNEVSAAGASGLIRCKQLRVIDLGDIAIELLRPHHPKYELPPEIVPLPTADNLIPLIENGADNVTYLRINHAVVTQLHCVKEVKAFEVADTSAHVLPPNVAELGATEWNIHELPEDSRQELPASIPILAELEGSPVEVVSPPPAVQSLETQDDRTPTKVTNETEPVSALSPVLDASGGLFSPISPLISQRPNVTSVKEAQNGLLTVPDTSLPCIVPSDGLEVNHQRADSPVQTQRRRTYSGVLSDHEARIRFRQSEDHNLLASTLGQIRTLVLTDVPTKSTTTDTARNIITFIKNCAEEERWAALQASVGYELPPGPDRRYAEREYARTLFPFRKLVLEMSNEASKSPSSPNARRRSTKSGPPPLNMLSSTLDPDCEAYLSAAKDDFSFFGSEECGQPDTEALAHVPLAAFREKMTLEGGTSQTNGYSSGGQMAVQEPLHDVLAEVSRFRRTKKAEYEAALSAGLDHVEGYWSGVIEVVRPR